MKTFLTTENLLRAGVAFAFVYPAVSAFFHPYSWIGYFPGFMLDVAGSYDMLLLHAFGLFEIALAVWIMFGKHIFIPATLTSILLFLIIVLNLNQMDVLFRDIPILLMALILLLKHRSSNKHVQP